MKSGKNYDGVKEEVVFCCWFDHEMSQDRRSAYENILETHDNVILLDNKNVQSFSLKENPIHPGFSFLSATHKSDYLRSYLMNFYGGGYTDIKKQDSSWEKSFLLLQHGDFFGCGYPEEHPYHIANTPKPFIYDYQNFVGNSAYIYTKNTPLTNEWFIQTKEKMDSIYDSLKVNPGKSHPRLTKSGIRDEAQFNTGYPLEWTELLGDIYHPIVYRYKNKILKNLPKPIMRNYR